MFVVGEVWLAQVEPSEEWSMKPPAPTAKHEVVPTHVTAWRSLVVPDVCDDQPSVWTAQAARGAMHTQAAKTIPIQRKRSRDG